MKYLKAVKELWEKEFETFFKDNTIKKLKEGDVLFEFPTKGRISDFEDSFMDKYNITKDDFELILGDKDERDRRILIGRLTSISSMK